MIHYTYSELCSEYPRYRIQHQSDRELIHIITPRGQTIAAYDYNPVLMAWYRWDIPRPDPVMVHSLYKWSDPTIPHLYKRGTMHQLNQWAREHGFTWKKEPRTLYGGHWHDASTGVSYTFTA